jgi:hypothetical protein
MTMTTTTQQTIEIGSRVCGTTGTDDDLDIGTVDETDGVDVTVSWDSGVRTTQPVDALRMADED